MWLDLNEDIEEEFSSLVDVPSLDDVVRRSVPSEIRYRVWSGREVERLPSELRKQVEHLTRSSALRAWHNQRTTEAAERKRAEKATIPKKRKPRGAPPPALTKYQLQYLKRKAMRNKLPTDREGRTLHFIIMSRDETTGTVKETDGYVQANAYTDGRLGEIFIRVGKSGSSSAVLDEYAKVFSIALQHGVPMDVLCEKGVNTNFEPSGRTNVKDIPACTSPIDLVCKWLLKTFKTEVQP